MILYNFINMKQLTLFLLLIMLSSCGHNVIVWSGMEIVGMSVVGLIISAIIGIWGYFLLKKRFRNWKNNFYNPR